MKYNPDKLPPGFSSAWEAYPKKVSKGRAIRAWHANDCEHRAGMIIAAIKDYQWPDDRQFIPYFSSWINAWKWLDIVVDEDEDNDW